MTTTTQFGGKIVRKMRKLHYNEEGRDNLKKIVIWSDLRVPKLTEHPCGRPKPG